MSERPRKDPVPDVVVVGGGILGLASACELLSQGYTVTLVESDASRSATRAAAGMLSPFAEVGEPAPWTSLLALALRSYPDFVRNVINTSGLHVEHHFPGSLVTGPTVGSGAGLEEKAAQLRALGAEVTCLDANEIFDREPELRADSALFLHGEGYVDPRALHDALRLAFLELGGSWIDGEVFDFLYQGDRVVGVQCGPGALHAAAVLNTTGHQCGRFLLPRDLAELRPTPVSGEIVRLRPRTKGESIRVVIQVPEEAYFVPQDDGSVLVGATVYPDDDRIRVTASGVRSLLAAAARYLPAADDWEWVEAWSGVRPRLGQGEPKAWADARPGLFHGMGLYRNGILLAPVVGAQLSRLVAEYLGQASRRSVGTREGDLA